MDHVEERVLGYEGYEKNLDHSAQELIKSKTKPTTKLFDKHARTLGPHKKTRPMNHYKKEKKLKIFSRKL